MTIVDFSPSFVGRHHECDAIVHQLALAGAATRVVMIAGEPGIGKTCLLDWVGAQAGRQSAAVLRGGASQAEGMPPYLPLLEALGRSSPPQLSIFRQVLVMRHDRPGAILELSERPWPASRG